MKHALAAVLSCLAILSGIVGTASGAYVDATSKNRVGVSEQNPNIHTYVLGSLELEPQRGDTILGYDPVSGVLFYVNQNPWTHFDPLGLAMGPSQERLDEIAKTNYRDLGSGLASGLARGVVQLGELAGRIYAMGIPDAPLRNSVDSKVVSVSESTQSNITRSVSGTTGANPASTDFTDAQTTGEIFAPAPPAAAGVKILKNATKAVKTVESAQDVTKAVEAAIEGLKQKGVHPMPGQRALDTDHVADLATKMENGEWDEAISFAETNRPGVMNNPDGTQTIISGHHRQVAEEMTKQKGIEFNLKKEPLSSTTNNYKGNWDTVERKPGSKNDP